MFKEVLESLPIARVDFNMTDSRGIVPALRALLSGFVPDPIVIGQRITVQDADGNTSEAVVRSVGDDILELEVAGAAAQSEQAWLYDDQDVSGFQLGEVLTVTEGGEEVIEVVSSPHDLVLAS